MPSHVGCTSYHSSTKVKQHKARPVLGWEIALAPGIAGMGLNFNAPKRPFVRMESTRIGRCIVLVSNQGRGAQRSAKLTPVGTKN